MKTRSRFLLTFLLALGVSPASAATRIALDGPWEFRIDPDLSGFRKGWQKTPPGDTESVALPHTWGVGRRSSAEARRVACGRRVLPRPCLLERRRGRNP
jgi:hypothetical protein